MKQRISVSLDKELLKMVDFLLEKKYDDLANRSALIEYYLRNPRSLVEDYMKFREAFGGRVLT